MIPPIPENEADRLRSLAEYRIMDTPPEAEFDDLTALAADICGTPIALIALVDASRHWIKSKVGTSISETPREQSFCAHVFGEEGLLLVPDATKDPRFSDNPLVTGDAHIRFYAGAPLITDGGHTLGTLCVLDRQPRELNDRRQEALAVLGRQVMARLELRRLGGKSGRVEAAMNATNELLRSTERHLRRIESVARMASRIARIGAWSIALPSRKATWSNEVRAIHEAEPGFEPTMDSMLAFHPAQHRERLRSALEACSAELRPFDLELELETARGRRIWVRIVGEAVKDEDGKVVQLQGAIQDITSRKRSEEEQRRLADRLASTLESITDAIMTMDRSWRFTFLNKEAARVLQRKRDELLGRVVWDEFPEAKGSIFEREYSRALTQGVSVSFEAYYPPLKTWFSVRAFPSEQGLAVYFRDVTASLAADLAIRTSEERFRLLAKATNDALWEWDLQTNALWWNEGYERTFGHRVGSGEQTILAWERHVHPEDFPRVQASVVRALEGTVEYWTDEYRFRRLDGSYAYVVDRGYIQRDFAGKAIRMIGGLTDITARREAEEATRRSNEQLARVVEMLQGLASPNLSLREILAHATAGAMEMARAGGAAIELVQGDELVCCAASGTAADQVDVRISKGRCLAWQAVLSNSLLVVDDVANDERVRGVVDRLQGVRALVVVPIRDDRGVVGVLRVAWNERRSFSSADLSNLQILVESLGAFIQRQNATEQLRASEAQYRLLFAGNPHPMWVFDLETRRFLAVNAAAVAQYGHTEEQFLSMTIEDIRPADQIEALRERLSETLPSGIRVVRTVHRKRDGTLIEVEVVSDGIVFEGRKARLVLAHDITQRSRAEREVTRANRSLQMLSLCNEALVRAETESELLSRVCAVAVDVGGFRMAWVGYADDGPERRIVPQAHAGVEDGYLAEVHLSWSEQDETGFGPAARSVREGRTVVVSDLTKAEARFVRRDEALRRGYKGVISLPLRDREHAFGILALYSEEVREIPSDELGVLQELSDNLAYGIVTLRARLERRRTHEAILAMARGVSATTGEAFFQRLAQSMVDALGADAALIADLSGGADPRARTLSVVVDGAPRPNFEISLSESACAGLLSSAEWVVVHGAGDLFVGEADLVSDGVEACVGGRLCDASGKAIGMMMVLFRRPLTQEEFVSSTLKIFAARAAAEMERLSADAKTREQAALLDKAQDAILVRDLDHRVRYWNKSAERLYGWTAAEAMGRSVRDLLYADKSQFDQALERVLSLGEWAGEVPHVSKDGRQLIVEGHWTLVRNELGKPVSVLAINTDITERRQLERQFLRAQRMESLGTLAGGIAHDLNNLLAPITMGVGLLKRLGLPPKGATVVESIERSAQRGADLVKQVLSFARGAEGARLPLQVSQVFGEVASIARNTFPKNITIDVDVAPGTPLILAEPTQIHQVLINLSLNARDAMPGGGRLAFIAAGVDIDRQFAAMSGSVQPGHYVMIQVVDTGSGIPREVLDRIFEPFFTTKEVGKGTGLGLSTVLGIVRSHGGFIDVRSTPGNGSTFSVYLPAHESAGLPSAEVVKVPPLPRGNGEVILVVDDEVEIRDITRHTLEAYGYRVLLAEDGAQAISLYAEQRAEIAAVITDMMMPVMDGVALVNALRRIDTDVRVIGMSGLNDHANLARATQGGIRHFIPKPFSAATVLLILRAVLSSEASASGHEPET